MSSKSNIVVVGYGFAGRSFHTYLISLVPDLNLHGVVARDPSVREKVLAERGCKTYESFEQAIEDPDVDGVVLATPHDTHAPLAIAALRAGKHVVTDKIMCLSLAECDALIAAAQQSGKLLTVFHNRRWDGDFLTLGHAMNGGFLGDVRWIEMSWQRYGASKRWRGQRAAGGGKVMDLGAHMLDQLLLLFPQPVESVFARLHYDWPDAEVESHAMITLAFEGGATAVMDVGSMTRSPKPRIYAVGTEATFVKHGEDPQEKAMIAGNIDAAAENPALYARLHDGKEERSLEPQPGRWRSFYENVADVLCRRAEPAVKLTEMRRLMAVMDAISDSARSGNAVRPFVR